MVSAAGAVRHTLQGDVVEPVSRVHRKEAIARLRQSQRAAGQLGTRRRKAPRRRKTVETISDELVRAAAKRRPTIMFKKRRSVQREVMA